MADQQDKPIYDEAKMRLMQEKINKSKARRSGPGCALFLMLAAAIFIGAMLPTIFPRMMLPIGGFLVCPADSTLEVTFGEKQQYIDDEGNQVTNTPVLMNCTQGYVSVKALKDGAFLVIALFYTVVLFLVMLAAYLIIRVYRRRNAELFEAPPPSTPPPA